MFLCPPRKIQIISLLLLLSGIWSSTNAQQASVPSAGAAKSADQNTTASSPTDSIHDTLPNPFTGKLIVLKESVPPRGTVVNTDIKSLEGLRTLNWSDANPDGGLYLLLKNYLPSSAAQLSCPLEDPSQVYIFHIVHWTPDGTDQFRMVSSSWYAYLLTKQHSLKFAGLGATGEQQIFNKKNAMIIGLSGFDKVVDVDSEDKLRQWLNDFTETYQTSVVRGTPENLKDLGLLLSSLGGFAGSSAGAGAVGAPTLTPIYVSVGCQHGTPKLPFTLNVTSSTVSKQGDKPPTSPTDGSISCTNYGNITPCASSHSFLSKDPEFWDVSIGITTPGTRETKYSFSSGTVQPSVTRHTDLYAMLDFFPSGEWLPKDSPCPHINVGIPVTSQSLYRPFFGLSENLTGWTTLQRKLSLPVGVNFFAGVVFMKTQYLSGSPTTQQEFNSDLKYTRVWKGVFGIEVPISSMISKIGSKGSSAKK